MRSFKQARKQALRAARRHRRRIRDAWLADPGDLVKFLQYLDARTGGTPEDEEDNE